MTTVGPDVAPAVQERRQRSGFWAVAFAFLIVMAFATLPSPLYGLYRTRDHLSAFMITVNLAIFAGGTIAALLEASAIASRIGAPGRNAQRRSDDDGGGWVARKRGRPCQGCLIGRLITGCRLGWRPVRRSHT